MAKKKLVILAALTGGNAVDREGAHVPISPAEIAEEAARCQEAGAAIIHIHARDVATGLPTGDTAVFSDIITRIRARCDALIQTTTGIGWKQDPASGEMVRATDAERMGLFGIKPRQDLVSIPPGTWDFWRPDYGYRSNPTYRNTPDFLRQNIAAIVAHGFPWEFEIADTGLLENASRLADEGVFDRNSSSFWLDYCLGFGGMPSTARHLVFAHDEGRRLFPNAKWQVLATDRDQFPMNTLGVSMGCDIVRVGFEDNIYLPDGRPARHNHELVAAMAAIGRAFGREPATPADAREMFEIQTPRDFVPSRH